MYDLLEISKGIAALFPEGSLIELRIPGKATVVGYFRDQKKLAEAIALRSGKVAAVYYTLNEPSPELYDDSSNKDIWVTGAAATADSQIVKRNWLLIDCDPIRVDAAGTKLVDQKVSATDSEKAEAFKTLGKIYEYLKAKGWPAPVTADSGNGYHLLYNLGGLENTPELTAVIKATLQHLAAHFDTPFVKVDTSVHNASRITKAYGSMACKGPNTDDRPHRPSRIRKVPAQTEPVFPYQMNLLEDSSPAPTPAKKGIVVKSTPLVGYPESETWADKVEDFLNFYDLDYKPRHKEKAGYSWQLIPCPFDLTHNIGEVGVSVDDTGKMGFKCFHNSCEGKNWQTFREHMEKTTDKKFFFTTNVKEAVHPNAETKTSLVFEKASCIKPEVLNWLWPNRVPFSKMTLFVGHPGIGKGMATMEIAARATTATGWVDCKNTNEPMEVLIISSEDAGGDTLVPRLMAANADLTKIQIFKTAKTKDGEKAFSMDTDLPALRKTLEDNPAIKLVIVDPVMNHLGRLKGNSEQELRSALTPLGLLATKFGLAVILVTHFNKSFNAEAIQRAGGAMGMVGAVRVAWTFTEDADTGTRQMLPLKANVSKNTGGLEYDIESTEVEIDGQMVSVGHMVFGKAAHTSIDSVLKNGSGTPTKLALTVSWLSERLSDGEAAFMSQIIAEGNVKGHEDQIIKNAYKKLGGKSIPAPEENEILWQLPKVGE